MAETKKRKTRKSKDSTQCCKSCIFFNNSDREHPLCSRDGKEVLPEYVCKAFDSTTIRECDRCHEKIKYTDRQSYYNAFVTVSIHSNSNSTIFQKLHLCHKCESDAFGRFEEFVDKLHEYTPRLEENKNEKE